MPSRRRLTLPALALTALLALAGCAAGPETGDDGVVRVVASTNVYGQIVEQIGGDRVSVTSIIGSGAQDPHSYEATARDQLAVQRAQLIVKNGGGYDPFIDSLMEAAGSDAAVIVAVEFAPGWPSEDFNEHVWFDPATMILVSEQIAADLTELDPAGAEEFATNTAALVDELEQVQGQLAEIAEHHAGEGVFLTEPLAGYLAEAAELVDLAPAGFAEAVEAGRDVSPSTMLAATRVIESGEVRAVLVNGQTAGAETKRIMDAAAAVGVPVVAFTETLPETAQSYARWMSDNVERLAAALGA